MALNTECDVTTENIAIIQAALPNDMRRAITEGQHIEAWTFFYAGGSVGQFLLINGVDGAVEYGADSLWGAWDRAADRLCLAYGGAITRSGAYIAPEESF